MKVVHNFAIASVIEEIHKVYGNRAGVGPNNTIVNSFENYPYPKTIGYWFIKDNDLYMVVEDGKSTKTKS